MYEFTQLDGKSPKLIENTTVTVFIIIIISLYPIYSAIFN